jgi:hypothetical protein
VTRIARTLVAALTAVGLLTLGVPAPGTSQEAAKARATLQVTPKVYTGGQKVTFAGSLGVRGKRTIKLQFHQHRTGDVWENVDYFKSRTNAAGKFSFGFPAPTMFGVSWRVVSGKYKTPAHTFEARSQELELTAGGDNRVTAGQSFTITVDTSPGNTGPTQLPPLIIPGRKVVLQQRVGADQWKVLDDGLVDASGLVRFTQSAATAGTVVYRAVQLDWTKNGDQIGWYPSFPTYVEVADPGTPRRPSARPQPSRTVDAPRLQAPASASSAGQKYKWTKKIYDFAWGFGESLVSKPLKGTKRKGRWLDVSDGTGRVSHVHGGLGIETGYLNRGGPGDLGTTSATLRGNAQTYGRWEVRGRTLTTENSAPDYTVKWELVPERAADYHCGAQNITLAEYSLASRVVRVGVKALGNDRQWTYTQPNVSLKDVTHNFAVEVARDHITWFMDAKPIASLSNRAAISGVPMTLRASLEGKGTTEMNRTRAIWDWQRAWPMDGGQQVRSGHGLTAGTHNGGC